MKNIELLRSLMLQGLLDVGDLSESSDFKKWISSGQYIVRSIRSATTLEIEINNDHAFNNMIAFDSCRMAAASFETMENIQSISSLPKSFGWIAIKSYYSAFFSAHSIMRLFGFMCSQLERGHVGLLNEYGNAMGLTGSIRPEAGFFSGKYNLSSNILTLKKMKNTHEDTWATFLECLNLLSTQVLNVAGISANKQQLSAEIDDLIIILTDGGRSPKGSYLSKFRNAINYRLEHDSWHPYGKRSIKSIKIVSMISTWRNDEPPICHVWKESGDAYKFFCACRDIVNINYRLIDLIVKNSTNSSNLYSRWPNRLLKITAAA